MSVPPPSWLPPEAPAPPTFVPPPPKPARGPAAWPWWSPVPAALAAAAVTLVGSALLAAVLAIAGVDITADETPPGFTIGATVIQDLALVVAAVAFAWAWGGRPTPTQFGLRGTRWKSAVGWFFVALAVYLVVSNLYGQLLGLDESDDLPDELGADRSDAALVGVVFLVCVLAPLAEEFFFRGYLFRAVRERWGLIVGLLVTGVLFGAVHAAGSKAEFLPVLALFGAVLAWLYHRTGSLYPCIALHQLNNTLALGYSLDWTFVDGLIPYAASGAVVVAVLAGVRRLPAADVRP